MTYKAARVIREADVVAVPGPEPTEALAYRIAVQVVPELAEKELLPIDMPMLKDRELLRKSRRNAGMLTRMLAAVAVAVAVGQSV